MRAGHQCEYRAECEHQLDGGDQPAHFIISATPPLLMLAFVVLTPEHEHTRPMTDQCGGQRAIVSRIAAEQHGGENERVSDKTNPATP